mmetsp:Transcript_26149/g.55351  ORF Transcript_26149/g.55351 Transcript_26149/m.55351 type:complete len:211 (-) Transcript_26149:732-1364(-)
MKPESTGSCFGCMYSKSLSAREMLPVWLQKVSMACAKSFVKVVPLATTSEKSCCTFEGSPLRPVTSKPYVASEKGICCSRARASTRRASSRSFCRMVSVSMAPMTSSVRGTPARRGKNSPSWWSLQARSTSWEIMWRGAMEAVATSPPCSAQMAWRLLKWRMASSKLLVFNAVLITTIVARVVRGTCFSFISATSLFTSRKFRDMNCMLS